VSRFLVDSERIICIYIQKIRIAGRVLWNQCKVAKPSPDLKKIQHPENIGTLDIQL
jgi:hypothetical protein